MSYLYRNFQQDLLFTLNRKKTEVEVKLKRETETIRYQSITQKLCMTFPCNTSVRHYADHKRSNGYPITPKKMNDLDA